MNTAPRLRALGYFVAGVITGVAISMAFVRQQGKKLPSRLLPYDRRPSAVRSPALIINRWSGDGRAERVGLASAADRARITTVMLERGDDLTELAHRAIDDGADAIGMAGGDGSLGIVAGVAAERDVPFFCIPVGTRNHFALDLGLDRDNPLTALDAVGGDEIRIDIAEVGDRIFLNNVSFGVYAHAVQDEGYRENKESTLRNAVAQSISDPDASSGVRYATPSGADGDSPLLLLVSNNPYSFAGPPDFGRRQRLDTGALGIGAVNSPPKGRAGTLPELIASGALEDWTSSALTLTSSEPIEAGVDGEALVFDSPLEISIRPKALRVLVPSGTIPGYVSRGERSVARLIDLVDLAGAPPAESDDPPAERQPDGPEGT